MQHLNDPIKQLGSVQIYYRKVTLCLYIDNKLAWPLKHFEGFNSCCRKILFYVADEYHYNGGFHNRSERCLVNNSTQQGFRVG